MELKAKRTLEEELLVGRMFELVWRLKNHRECGAFEKLCQLNGHKCVLTAAISYIQDVHTISCCRVRHYRDWPVSDVNPSGLNCCLRVMEGIAIHHIRHDTSQGTSRLKRCARACRILRSTQCLCVNEKISCEVLLATVLRRHLINFRK